MLFKNITVLNENFEIEEGRYVLVKDGIISSVADSAPEEYKGEIYEGKGKLLMPAFYNAHAHSPMTLMRGYGENMVLQDWLKKRIFPFEDKLNSRAVYWGTTLAMAESIRFGIVSSSDMYYFIDDMVRAVADSGAKANISRAITNFDNNDVWNLPSVQEMQRTYEAYHNTEDGRIRMDMSIHAEYTSNEAGVRAVAGYAKEKQANMHIHISETELEHEECKKRHNGMTPVQYFNSLGAFDTPTTAAHCVWVEPEDFDILKEKGVTVASNPISNLKLASGVCNVPELLRRGIRVAIGTDSVASNNSLNFFEEMKVFATASKMYYHDPTAVTPADTLRAATINGAESQGRSDCGRIAEGCRADLIVLDIDQPNMHPVHNMVNNLVYSASGSDIVLTMADGKVLYRDGEYMTIDLERTLFEVQKETETILHAL
ncbi:MAG: amidohydrolase [Firmicutes bacterium]|nr:amidohydrolase [Bacillota bacterium]MDD7601057.1 amidohydrolase [Bacillota bacterium]MDY5856077.1 amidohydrolase [Anaerovoracaceae bacterium]